jgi:hypothetical protein
MKENNGQAGEKLEWNGVWVGDCPEAEQLKRLDCLEIDERWNNRLVLEQCSIGEQYIRGRLAVACYLHLAGNPDGVQNAAFVDNKRHIDKLISVLIFCANPSQGLDRGNRDEELVLVDVVQLPNFPDIKVPSAVRLYLVTNEDCEIGEGSLYRSEILGGYKILPFVPYRERNSVIVFPDKEGCDIIEGASEIVNCIADDKGRIQWGIGNRIQLKQILPGISVQFAEVRIEERFKDVIQLVDVAVGPLNL